MQKHRRFLGRVSATCSILALAACGGGGGGSGNAPPVKAPFAALVNTTNPTGDRIDVSTLNLFPYTIGDSVVYDKQVAGTTVGTATRDTMATVGAQFAISESDSTSTSAPDILKYVVGSFNGEVHVQLQDPLQVSVSAPAIYNRVTVLDEYVTPLFPIGGVRLIEAQGDAEADADGDGLSDSYRFQYTQVFRGFESIDVLGAQRQAAHFTNTATLTIRGTRGGADSVTTGTEDTYYAPDVGLVQRTTSDSVRDGLVVTPGFTILARRAIVSGIAYP